jgi:predicted transcriptional regulator
MISEDAVLDFAASLFKSVWALELLLVLKRDPARSWQADQLIHELRSSRGVIAEALGNLQAAGLVVEHEAGKYRYHASSADIDEMVNEVQKIYDTKPAAVIREIVTAPNRKLKLLSDAFRFKKE